MLEINGLSIRYGAVEVVHSISLKVEEGQIVALLGSNGAGKSSILKAISGIKQPSSGNILFLGTSLVGMPPHQIVAAGVAHVMEGRHLFGSLTVEDNLALAASCQDGGNGGSFEDVYRRWPILRERCRQTAGTLSGGEQQMLAIARALMTRPRLMILDEPSWGLAPRVVRELMKTVKTLQSEGMTILLCEQMANLALNICDAGYVMSNGRVVLSGNADELLSNPDLQAIYLGGDVGNESDALYETKAPSTRRPDETLKSNQFTPDPRSEYQVNSTGLESGSNLIGQSTKARRVKPNAGVPLVSVKADNSEQPHQPAYAAYESLFDSRKNTETVKTANGNADDATRKRLSTGTKYSDLFNPDSHDSAKQKSETGLKALKDKLEEKEATPAGEASSSQATISKTDQQDFRSREIARQKKQATWRNHNKQ